MTRSITVNIEGRARGLWRARLAAWLTEWLLSTVRFEYRMDGGKWRRLQVAWSIDVSVGPPGDDDGDGFEPDAPERVAVTQALETM